MTTLSYFNLSKKNYNIINLKTVILKIIISHQIITSFKLTNIQAIYASSAQVVQPDKIR